VYYESQVVWIYLLTDLLVLPRQTEDDDGGPPPDFLLKARHEKNSGRHLSWEVLESPFTCLGKSTHLNKYLLRDPSV
jgi:hypothetical protein